MHCPDRSDVAVCVGLSTADGRPLRVSLPACRLCRDNDTVALEGIQQSKCDNKSLDGVPIKDFNSKGFNQLSRHVNGRSLILLSTPRRKLGKLD